MASTVLLKLVDVTLGLYVDQHTLAGEGDLLRKHQGIKLVGKAETNISFCCCSCCLIDQKRHRMVGQQPVFLNGRSMVTLGDE